MIQATADGRIVENDNRDSHIAQLLPDFETGKVPAPADGMR